MINAASGAGLTRKSVAGGGAGSVALGHPAGTHPGITGGVRCTMISGTPFLR
jgi:hypothetical protein